LDRKEIMPGPLDGIRVIDFGIWVAAPATAGILADWGAEVVKVEPLNGDPMRGVLWEGLGSRRWQEQAMNPPFSIDNRGKRSISLNVAADKGRKIFMDLLNGADVLVTNLRPRALERLSLSYGDVASVNPRLVYCDITGYGSQSTEKNRATYDIGAFWSRAGVAATIAVKGESLPVQPSGMGDHITAQGAAGAVCAALLARERSGSGQRVSCSIYRAGLYALSFDASLVLEGTRIEPRDRSLVANPLVNCYQAADGLWFWLLALQSDRHWVAFCSAIERPQLVQDERFSDIHARRKNTTELVRLLDEVFRQKTRHEWSRIFDETDVWWAPVQTLNDFPADPIASEAGVLTSMPEEEDKKTIAPVADFSRTPWRISRGPPAFSEHTEEILLELGYDWDQIVELKEANVVP
jgi:crotonobetainyl-CoA:carnitine CoA-transferase CaiB-like acyl-CoA transferase